MDTLETPQIEGFPDNGPSLDELSDYHRHILSIHQDISPIESPLSPDAAKLMKFNGYYALTGRAGAFFGVDVNIYVMPGPAGSLQVFYLTLLISLDGRDAIRIPVTGTFDGTRLVQPNQGDDGVSLDLTFHHTDGVGAVTATCSGHITLPGGPKTKVHGVTCNNPIPYSVFVGNYKEGPLPVLRIQDDYSLLYDFGSNDGTLKPVDAYVYNLNMYYFTLRGDVKLIMGTAAGCGLACNNIYKGATGTIARSLETIPFPDKTPFPNIRSKELAEFSGYYQLPEIGRGAFVSIQGEYSCKKGVIDRHVVWIGVSTDGVTSNSYYFDHTMSFDDHELITPDLRITFERGYDEETGYLAKITGSVEHHHPVTGHTYFNPIPLSDFGGVPLTDKKGESLTVVSDTEIIHNGIGISDFVYIPVMYILATETMMLSFGTAGRQGTACIVTGASGLSSLYAIPAA